MNVWSYINEFIRKYKKERFQLRTTISKIGNENFNYSIDYLS